MSSSLSPSANSAIGAIGSACILGAYLLLTFSRELERFTCGRVTDESVVYQSLNLLGGAFAAASAYLVFNIGALPLAILETIWAIIALAALLKMWIRRNSTPSTSPSSTSAAAAASASATVVSIGLSKSGAAAEALSSAEASQAV